MKLDITKAVCQGSAKNVLPAGAKAVDVPDEQARRWIDSGYAKPAGKNISTETGVRKRRVPGKKK